MGGVYVKNTMVEALMQIVAPHLCLGCAKIGTPLCTNCKYNITSEPFSGCILCGKHSPEGVCAQHDSGVCKAWVVGNRQDVLKNILNAYKFEYLKSAAHSLSDMLDTALPLLPHNSVIVPVPTAAGHVRERGFNHINVLARLLAKSRDIRVVPLLSRSSSTTQHRLNRVNRQHEASKTFFINSAISIDPTTPVLLLDDIITTGSTITAAAKVLAEAGVETIMVAALAYQPLD
jgi:ComF family protein